MREERLSEGQHALLGSNTATLQQDEVLLHLPVVGEPTHGGDGLISQVVISGSVVLHQLPILHGISSTHPVDLLVDLCPVVVSLLSSSRHSELDPARMPGTDTGNLPQALVRLPGQLLGVPSAGNTLEPMSLSHTNDVDHLILSEDSSNWNLLLEMISGKVNLVGNRTTVQLDLHNMGLLLPASENLHLGVDDDPDSGAVLLHLAQLLLNLLLAQVIGPLSAGLREGLLLRLRPVLVESPLSFFSNMLGPNSLQSPQTSGSLDIAPC